MTEGEIKIRFTALHRSHIYTLWYMDELDILGDTREGGLMGAEVLCKRLLGGAPVLITLPRGAARALIDSKVSQTASRGIRRVRESRSKSQLQVCYSASSRSIYNPPDYSTPTTRQRCTTLDARFLLSLSLCICCVRVAAVQSGAG